MTLAMLATPFALMGLSPLVLNTPANWLCAGVVSVVGTISYIGVR